MLRSAAAPNPRKNKPIAKHSTQTIPPDPIRSGPVNYAR